MEKITWTLLIIYVVSGLVAIYSYYYVTYGGRVWKSIGATIGTSIPMLLIGIPIIAGLLLGKRLYEIEESEVE